MLAIIGNFWLYTINNNNYYNNNNNYYYNYYYHYYKHYKYILFGYCVIADSGITMDFSD